MGSAESFSNENSHGHVHVSVALIAAVVTLCAIAALRHCGLGRRNNSFRARAATPKPVTSECVVQLEYSGLTRQISSGSSCSAAETVSTIVNASERVRIEELRCRVQSDDVAGGIPGGDRWYEDVELLRYVRARKTLEESEVLFREAMSWRIAHARRWGVDIAATGSFGIEHTRFADTKANGNVKAALRKHGDYSGMARVPHWWTFLESRLSLKTYGADRNGLPIAYQALGHDDLQGCVREVGLEALIRFAVVHNDYFLDVARQVTRTAAVPGTMLLGGIIIVDLDGLSVWRHYGEASVFVEIAKVVKILHLERQRRLYVIRAPRAFAAVWRLIKSLVDLRTREKIVILGPNDSLQPLIDELGAENVPDFLGGTCTDVPKPSTSLVPPGAFQEHMSSA